MIALDASLALAWTFADERTEAVTALFHRVVEEGAVVPAHWHLEVANSLRTAIRRGRATIFERDGFLQICAPFGSKFTPRPPTAPGARYLKLPIVMELRPTMPLTWRWPSGASFHSARATMP